MNENNASTQEQPVSTEEATREAGKRLSLAIADWLRCVADDPRAVKPDVGD